MALREPKFVASEQALFFRKADEGTGGEKESKYEEYRALGGILNQEQYQNVLRRIGDKEALPRTAESLTSKNPMVTTSGIILSPETAVVYGILRYEKPDQKEESYQGKSDQELLADALRFTGDKRFLDIFIAKHPHIFG